MDMAGAFVAHWGMGVTPLPRRGGVLSGRDAAARMLRVSYHPEVARVVLSIWDHDVCMATLRLAPDDVPDLVRALTATLVQPAPVPAGVPASGSSTVAIQISPQPSSASA